MAINHFKHKYSMTESVKMNYKRDATFTKLLWKCQECMNQDTEIHLLWCPAYKELRMGMDLSSDARKIKNEKLMSTLLACKAALVSFLFFL